MGCCAMRMVRRIGIGAAIACAVFGYSWNERAAGVQDYAARVATFPLEQWKAAVLAGDVAELRAMYSES